MGSMEETLHLIKEVSLPVRRMLYLVSVNESSVAPGEIPIDHFTENSEFLFGLIVLESVLLWLKGQSPIRLADGVTSLAMGMFMMMPQLLFRPIELITYVYFYDNWRLFTLPWDSPLTWFICMVGTDFGYYCFHRMAHEVNILWAAHQVHHSSEEYNLTTAARQSIYQRYYSWVFYLPLALVVPPNVFLVHYQLNLFYQFWLHTELIGKLGPLEYILNTPSHHRVHHGRNRYCIDKNYAGVLIIFDRMFGTFAAEEEPVVYGLVHPLQTYGLVEIQIHHLRHIAKKVMETSGLINKLKVVFYGPGWNGKADCPKLGNIEDVPDVHRPVERLSSRAPMLESIYTLLNFLLVNLLFYSMLSYLYNNVLSQLLLLAIAVYMLWSLTTFGFIFDQSVYALPSELLRLIVAPLIVSLMPVPYALSMATIVGSVLSIGFWILQAWMLPSTSKSKLTMKQRSKSD